MADPYTRFITLWAHADGTYSVRVGGFGPRSQQITSDAFTFKSYAEAASHAAGWLKGAEP